MKQILMIAYSEYPYDARVRREAEALAHSGLYEVSVLTLKTGERPKTSEIGGVKIFEIDQAKYVGSNKLLYILAYFCFFLRCLLRCSWLSIKGQVDLVHVHNMPDFLVFAAVLPRLCGCPLVLDIHDSMPETYLSKFTGKNSLLFKLLSFEEQASAAIAQRVVCVNEVQKGVLVDRGIQPDKITIAMNMPDPALFPQNSNPGAAVPKDGVFRMVYHGTIAERLGVDLTVQAMAKFSPAIPGLEFHIWSKAGPAIDAIEKLARDLNVVEKVKLLRGGVPLERLADQLKIMDLGVIGNRKGAATDLMLPVKLLEYVALDIPVVAPRLKCIQHYFSESMVSFFEPEDIDSMAEAILKIYRDLDRRQEQPRQAKAFLERYGWERHKQDLIRMYDNIFGEKTS
jgi:glycosyltransferase involved in cell wall biosynthesis